MGKKKHQKRETNISEFPSSSNSIESGNVYTSPPFKFIVEGRAFYLHAALVSHYSKPLDVLMNGEMSEAQKGSATIEDVEEDTFGRFAEWLNKGYYTPKEAFTHPVVNDGEAEKSDESVPSEHDFAPSHPEPPVLKPPHAPFGRWTMPQRSEGSTNSKKNASWNSIMSSRSQLRESFINREAIIRQQIPHPRPNQSPEEDHTNVFLSHAELYVFAEQFDIQTLRTLALANLQTALAIFTLHEERTGDIITLLRYAYANTSDRSGGVEDLRTLLRDYVGYEMDILMKDDEFRDLMIADGGALLGDFMTMVMKRISD
ncbi:MAG: hypothetical protein Q9180_005805 [Flavoplaca navasiana]